MICIYHRKDLDGWCSGAIVKHFYPDAVLVGMDYDIEFPWEIVLHDADKRVMMVDFALKMPEMRQLAGMCSLIWIDHHITAVEAAVEAEFYPQGIQESGMGACILTWEWCAKQENQKRPDYLQVKGVPRGVRLLGKYDVGLVDDDSRVLMYEYGVRTNVEGPESSVWKSIFDDYSTLYQAILNAGEHVVEYVRHEQKKLLDLFAFEGMFGGYPALFLNTGIHNTLACKGMGMDRVYQMKPVRLFVTFCRTPHDEWYVIVEGDDPDIHCGRLCEKYGGGGHDDVGGFHGKTLPFLIDTMKKA